MIAKKILVIAIDLILRGGEGHSLEQSIILSGDKTALESGTVLDRMASEGGFEKAHTQSKKKQYNLSDFQSDMVGEVPINYVFLGDQAFDFVDIKKPIDDSMIEVETVTNLVSSVLSDAGKKSLSSLKGRVSIATLRAHGIIFDIDTLNSVANIKLDPEIIGLTNDFISDQIPISTSSSDIALTSQFTIKQTYSELETDNGEEWFAYGALSLISHSSELNANFKYQNEIDFNNIILTHRFDNKNKVSLGDVKTTSVSGHVSQERIKGVKFFNNSKVREIDNDRIVTDVESEIEVYADGILVDTFHVGAGAHNLPMGSFDYDEDVKIVVRDVFGVTTEYDYLGNKKVSGFDEEGDFSYSISLGEDDLINNEHFSGYLNYGVKDNLNLSGFYEGTDDRWLAGAGIKKAFDNNNKLELNTSVTSFNDSYGYKADAIYQYRLFDKLTGSLRASRENQNFRISELNPFNSSKSVAATSLTYSNIFHEKDNFSFNYSYNSFHKKHFKSRERASLSYKIEPVKDFTLGTSLSYASTTGNSVVFSFSYRPTSSISISHSHEKKEYLKNDTTSLSIYKNPTNLYGNVSNSDTNVHLDASYDHDNFGLRSSYEKYKNYDKVKYSNSMMFGVSATKNSIAFTREATKQPMIKVSLDESAPDNVTFSFGGEDYTVSPGKSVIIPNLQSFREYKISVNSIRFPMGYSTDRELYEVTTGQKGVYDINIGVTERKSLTGRIVDINGVPLKYFEGRVIVGGISHDFFTDENGEYFLYNAEGIRNSSEIVIGIAGEKIPLTSVVETDNSILRANTITLDNDLSYLMK